MPNAAQQANFLIYQRKKKFTNCASTVESSRIVCAPLTKEAAKRLKHCNNANTLRNRRFKVTIECSLSPLGAPIRPNQNSIEDFACCASVFRPIIKEKHNLKPMWSPLR